MEPQIAPITQIKIINLNNSQYQKMRENAYTLCKSKFDINTNIDVWENYYKNITTNVQK